MKSVPRNSFKKIMVIERISGSGDPRLLDIDRLLASEGLRRTEADYFYGAYDGEELVGCGGLQRNILQMLAVKEKRQSEGIMNEIVSSLIASATAAGTEDLYIYAKTKYADRFHLFGFAEVVRTRKFALLHRGKHTIQWYLKKYSPRRGSGSVGSVVMNANPMTLGHLHLVRTALRQEKRLLVFVVEEDRSEFLFSDRFGMVKETLSDYPQVQVLPSGPYLVSGVSFPTYFLKSTEQAHGEFAALDARIFQTYFVPFFSIGRRYVGEESMDPSTKIYNETLKRILAPCQVIEIPRLTGEGGIISASRVRALLQQGKKEEAKHFVPDPVRRYLDAFSGT